MKQAIEFLGEIESGIIRLPKNYTSYTAKNVRVILLIEEKEEVSQEEQNGKEELILLHSQKEKLQQIFEKMKGKAMFSKIDNPTEWQKNIRNEWE